MKPNYINNLKGLDPLRFVLSISVIIWHYQHFYLYFVPYDQREVFVAQQPFFNILKIFYTQGSTAVQVFWLISGIIFYKIYYKKIEAGKTTFKIFGINRFSRLYPLHFITLLLVILLQWYFVKLYGQNFIYGNNTPQMFIQNLLFAQAWGVERGSFNGPTWSVSIEILVYMVFFWISFTRMLGKTRNILIVVCLIIVLYRFNLVFVNPLITQCFLLFFMGCLLIKLYDEWPSLRLWQYLAGGITICIIALIALIALKVPAGRSFIKLFIGGIGLREMVIAVVLTLACLLFFNLPVFNKINNKYFQFFGDLTYSTYLLHFPIQLLLFMLLKPGDYIFFNSKWVFCLYLGTIIVLGRLCYLYLELPLQSFLRNKLEGLQKR